MRSETAAMEITTGGLSVSITHSDRLLFPDDGLTKGDVASYYARAADVMAPFLQDRIISVECFPHGVGGESFYQRHAARHYPDYVRRVSLQVKKKTVEDVVGDPPATIVHLANLSCLTFHTWMSRIDNLTAPDTVVFDLDPSVDDFALVRRMALALRDLLKERGFVLFVKTTGSRGLHVVVPIVAQYDYETVLAFATDAAKELIQQYPDQLTLEFYKKDRGDRIYLDIFRNGYGASAVAPYSLRPRPGAPVAAPVPWDAVASDHLQARQLHFTHRRPAATKLSVARFLRLGPSSEAGRISLDASDFLARFQVTRSLSSGAVKAGSDLKRRSGGMCDYAAPR